jgi:hypothetical protein
VRGEVMKASGKLDGAQLRMEEAIAWIEAALQASLGAEDDADRSLAVKALKSSGPDQHLQAWLETVAAEIDASSVGEVQAELVRAMAARMLEDRERFLRAHGPVDKSVIRNLVRRS